MRAGRMIAAPAVSLAFHLLLVSAAFGQTSAVNALTAIEASRAEGFGGAAAAIGRDASVSWLNPAAAAQTSAASLTLAGQRGYFNEGAGQALISAPFAKGAVFAGLIYFDAGTMLLNSTDGSSKTARIQQDFLGSLGYAAVLAGSLAGGISVKAIRSEIFDNSANAFALDAGLQTRVNRHVKAGACLQNLGSKLKYQEDAVDLPTLFRAGIAAGGWLNQWGLPSLSEADKFLVIIDAEFPLAEQDFSVRGGVEYQIGAILALRAGARLGNRDELGAFSTGIGLSVGQYRLDYSIRFGGDFSNPQTLSLTISLLSPSR